MWQLTRPPYYCHSQMRIADCEKSSTVFVVACRDGHDCCPIEMPAMPAPRSWAERLKKTEPRVRYGFLPPPRPLASGCENEACCPSQPQEDANGKLCAILVGGRFSRSPVDRVPINPLLHSTTDRNLGTVTNRDASRRSSWRFESTLFQNPITEVR